MNRSEAKALGLTRYSNGNPCPKGHESERMVSNGTCVLCLKAQKLSNWIARGRPKQKPEISKRYRQKHGSIVNERIYAWKRENPERALNHQRQARKNNPEKYRSYVRNRRASIAEADGFHDEKDIDGILKGQGFICAACPEDLSRGYEVDHVHPVSRGGSNWPSNLQCLCMPCNRSKGDKTMDEWAAYKSAKLAAQQG